MVKLLKYLSILGLRNTIRKERKSLKKTITNYLYVNTYHIIIFFFVCYLFLLYSIILSARNTVGG